MGIWTPQEDEPKTCDWCRGLITSPEHPSTLERDYCSTACQAALMDAADEINGGDEDGEHEFGCCFPNRCLMLSEHLRGECYDVEMAKAWQEEQMQNA